MVLMQACSYSKALGGFIPETNASLCSGLMGYDCCQITRERGAGSQEESGSRWSHLPSVFPTHTGLKLSKHLALKKFTHILKDSLLSHRLWAHYVLDIVTSQRRNTQTPPCTHSSDILPA